MDRKVERFFVQTLGELWLAWNLDSGLRRNDGGGGRWNYS